MKITVAFFAVLLFVLMFVGGCRSYERLPPILNYQDTEIKYNTSAAVELLPGTFQLFDDFLFNNLKKCGYRVEIGVSYAARPSQTQYLISAVDWKATLYSCQKGDYIDTRVIVAVRTPGIVLDGRMYAPQARYFQAYSQVSRINNSSYNSGLRLAVENLFLTKEFRQALEPLACPEEFKNPPRTAEGYWQASLYYQMYNRYDFYSALRWAFLAMDKGSADAEKYIAENGVIGEIFSNIPLLIELAHKTPVGVFRLGRMYEFGRGLPVDKKMAFLLYDKAAKKNVAEAQYAVGRCYHYGIGQKQDLTLADHWYGKAAGQNYWPAYAAQKKLELDKRELQ